METNSDLTVKKLPGNEERLQQLQLMIRGGLQTEGGTHIKGTGQTGSGDNCWELLGCVESKTPAKGGAYGDKVGVCKPAFKEAGEFKRSQGYGILETLL